MLAGIGTGFLVVTFAQARGLIEDDTKLPLILTPVAYFKSAIHLWSDHLFAGAATQSADLLFPMGPFFAFAQLFHIPTWCAERIWLALLFTVGCWGVVRLAEALGIGRRSCTRPGRCGLLRLAHRSPMDDHDSRTAGDCASAMGHQTPRHRLSRRISPAGGRPVGDSRRPNGRCKRHGRPRRPARWSHLALDSATLSQAPSVDGLVGRGRRLRVLLVGRFPVAGW